MPKIRNKRFMASQGAESKESGQETSTQASDRAYLQRLRGTNQKYEG